VKICRFSDVNC